MWGSSNEGEGGFGRIGARLLWVVMLVVLTQLTRFSSTIKVSVDKGTITASVDNSTASAQIGPQPFSGVRVQTQHSMISRSLLSAFTLERPGRPVVQRNFSGLFLFGQPLPAPSEQSIATGFQPSFGDWTHDRYNTAPQRIVSEPLGDTFTLTATFLGRGDHFVVLEGAPELRVFHRDGFMDNDFTVCYPERCLFVSSTTESITQNVLRLLNFVFEAALLATLLALAVQLLNSLTALWVRPGAGAELTREWEQRCERVAASRALIPSVLAALVVVHIGLAVLCSAVLDAVPHVPESQGAYRSAELLARGMVGIPSEAAQGLGTSAAQEMLLLNGILIYPFGHFWPALLAPFVALGIPAAANIFFSVVNVLLLVRVGRREFGDGVALTAAVVYAFSPLTVLLAGEYLPGPATVCMLLLSCFALQRCAEKVSWPWAMCAGAAFTYAFALRQSAALAAVPVLLALLWQVVQAQRALRPLIWVIAGVLPVAALLVLDNKLLTGAYFSFPDTVYRNLSLSFANLPLGINHTDSTVAFFTQMIFSAPGVGIPLAFAVYGIATRLSVRTVLLAVVAASYVAVHCFLASHGLHAYGPRLMYEALVPLAFLIGVGVSEFIARLTGPNRKVAGACLLTLILVTDIIRLVGILPRYQGYNGVRRADFVARAGYPRP